MATAQRGVLFRRSKASGVWHPRHLSVNGSFLTLHRTAEREPKSLAAMVDLEQVVQVEVSECPVSEEVLPGCEGRGYFLTLHMKPKAGADLPTARDAEPTGSELNDENRTNANARTDLPFKLRAPTSAEAQHWVSIINTVREKIKLRKSRLSRSLTTGSELALPVVPSDNLFSSDMLGSLDEADSTEDERELDLASLLGGDRDGNPDREASERESPLVAIKKVLDALEAITQSPASPEARSSIDLSAAAIEALEDAVDAVAGTTLSPEVLLRHAERAVGLLEQETVEEVSGRPRTPQEMLLRAEQTIALLSQLDASTGCPDSAVGPSDEGEEDGEGEETLEAMMHRWAQDDGDCDETGEFGDPEAWEGGEEVEGDETDMLLPDGLATENEPLLILPVPRPSTQASSTFALIPCLLAICLVALLAPHVQQPSPLQLCGRPLVLSMADLLTPVPLRAPTPQHEVALEVIEHDELTRDVIPRSSRTVLAAAPAVTLADHDETVDELAAQIETLLARGHMLNDGAADPLVVAAHDRKVLLTRVLRSLAEAPRRLMRALLRVLGRR